MISKIKGWKDSLAVFQICSPKNYNFFFQEFELDKCKEISDIAKVKKNVSSLAHKQH